MLRRLPAMILAIDATGRVSYWNDECQRVLGYTAGEAVGTRDFVARLLPDDAARAALKAWIAGAEPSRRTFDTELLTSAGEHRSVTWTRFDPGAGAASEGSWALGHDVTPQHRSERELLESRERLRTAFEALPFDFWVMGTDGRYTMINSGARSRWGDPTGLTPAETGVPPEVAALWMSHNARAFAGDLVREEVRYVHGGESRTYDSIVAPIRHADGRVSGILGINIDITDRKNAEDALRRSEQTKSAILDALPDLMFRMSADGRYLDFRAPPGTPLLAPPDVFLGSRVHDVIPGPLADLCADCIRRTLSLGGVQSYEYSLGDEPGRHYEVRMSACGADEVIVLIRNVSEIKNVEKNLRESESRYRALFEAAPMGLFVVQDGRMVMSNQAGLAILGASSPLDLLGRSAADLVMPADVDSAVSCIATALRDGRSPPHVESLKRLDGSPVPVEAAGARINLGGRPAVQVTVQDVSQRIRDQAALREIDEQLRQAQKMEALGQLAAGVAHDFNNLLTAIFGYLSLARTSLESSSPAWTALNGVEAAAEQAAGVVRSLMAVSRKAVAQFKPVDLRTVAAGALELLRAGLSSTISVVLESPDTPVMVQGDAILLKQVVLNLAINARDAMPRGGTLRVSVLAPGHDGPTASLRVRDTGVGIPADVRPRIFEPFFTTKSRETSSGLGLSVAEGIVRAHSGTIDVQTTPGEGSEFIVRVPATASPAPGTEPARAIRAAARTERILIIEQNRQVREVIGSALARTGYGIQYAPDLDGVLRALAQGAPGVDLAVVNVDLADGVGAESLARLRRANPRMPLIVLTGRAAHEIEIAPPARTVHKPFQVAQISDLATEMLDEARSSPEPDQGEPAP